MSQNKHPQPLVAGSHAPAWEPNRDAPASSMATGRWSVLTCIPRWSVERGFKGGRASLGGLLLLTILLLLAGCVQKISYQPRYEPLEQSAFFADGRASRHLVPGTVARGLARTDALLYNGTQEGHQAEIFPFQITAAVMQRGQQRFNIYCSPCHSESGDGNGMVVQRGFPSPPSLHEDRLRTAPVGYLFEVITNGHGVMPSYANQIPAEDRWAIIAYVRALQLSQHAPVSELPTELQEQLNGAAQ